MGFTFFTFMGIALFSYVPGDNGIMSLSIHNVMSSGSQNLSGKVGASVASLVVEYLGFVSWLVVCFGLIVTSYSLRKRVSLYHILSAASLVIVISAVVSTFMSDMPLVHKYSGGGILGGSISDIMLPAVGQMGIIISSVVALCTYFMYVKKECL